jgi:AraC-like DNA-binding protein
MMSDGGADPLHRFPVFLTSDPEVLWHHGSTLLGATRIDLVNVDNFQARVNFVSLADIGLVFGATSCDLCADLTEADIIRLQIGLKGRAMVSAGDRSTDFIPSRFVVTSNGIPSRSASEAGHERLTLRLNPARLMQKLTSLVGVRPRGEMSFEPAVDADQPYARSLRHLLQFMTQQLDSTAFRLPAAASYELEQAVQIAFLWASRHSFSHLLEMQDKEVAPAIVRRLEEFIEAHWREPLSIERLVAETSVSARSIFRAFLRARGYSPMAFAKAVRLRHARAMLTSGDPGVSVTTTAFQCNFASPGHFARDYREAFGELPSETISRSRR